MYESLDSIRIIMVKKMYSNKCVIEKFIILITSYIH